jgi:hypothetical protein
MLASQEVTLAFGHHQDRTPTHGREPSRNAAFARWADPAAATPQVRLRDEGQEACGSAAGSPHRDGAWALTAPLEAGAAKKMIGVNVKNIRVFGHSRLDEI